MLTASIFRRTAALAACLFALLAGDAVQADEPLHPECIAPAQPGGGFDLTCRLAVKGLQQSGELKAPMRIVYMPGGIGAVAYDGIVNRHPDEPGTIVAYSGGSLLNLAQGKFGRYTVNDVRWLAAIGADYGVVVVRDDSPFTDLKSLMEALKEDPTKIVFGAGGTMGSQDWMKAVLTAKAAGVDYRKMRFVAFEGGGDAVRALYGGHIQVYMGDASEAFTIQEGGTPIRILAVFNDKRLPGKFANVPTAQEQGYDIVWPLIRGFYVGPKVSDKDYQFWVDAFDKMMATPEFARLREQEGLFPFAKTGPELDAYIKEQVRRYATLADSLGLIKK